jgi:hypothetical protein
MKLQIMPKNILLAALFAAFLVAPTIALALALPPIVLQPGDSQPILCSNNATPIGTTSNPTCPTPAPTATPATVTLIAPSGNTIYRITCFNGQTAVDLGVSGVNVLVFCPPVPTSSPTSNPTSSPTPTATATP